MSKAAGAGLAVASLFTLAAARGGSAAESDPHETFGRFCIQHFAAEKEPEVYRTFGRELKIVAGSVWRHVSERSACVAWQTNLPARSLVAYGPSADRRQRTQQPDRPVYTHLHTLRGLRPGSTVHYRLVAVDERGRRIESPAATLTTPTLTAAVRIPDDVPGPPYVLDRPNATYLVTRDIAADGTAIFIAASGITLDLGGHTITYDGTRDTAGQGACGVRGHKSRGIGLAKVKVVNGLVRQGRGGSRTRKLWDTLYNPLFFSKPSELELAGLTLDYGGQQVVAIALLIRGQRIDVHHNVIVDRGTTLLNRHIGMDAIAFGASDSRCHRNLVLRTRHRGIKASSGCAFEHNEIYVDSHATNSYGIMVYGRGGQKVEIRGNRIFGTGYHPVGLGSYQGYSHVRAEANYIQMQGTPPQARCRSERAVAGLPVAGKLPRAAAARWRGGQGGGDDPSQLHPVNGIRLQKPGASVEHVGNVVVVKGRGKGTMMRGLWMVPGQASGPGLVFRGNRVKLIAEDREAEGYALSAGGVAEPGEDATVQLADNVVLTNLCHVQFGDNYSHGGRYRFLSNRFVRLGDDPRYRTIRMGWRGWKYESFGHTFVDTVFGGGAGYDSVSFDGAQRGRYDFDVGWTLELRSDPGAEVTVTDATGAVAFTGRVPPGGALAIPLVAYRRSRAGQGTRRLTPHTVVVEGAARRATRDVTMDGPKTLELRP